jgi:hypothetical protein
MSFLDIKLVRDVLPRFIIQKGNQINNLNNIPNDENKIFYYTYIKYGNMNTDKFKKIFYISMLKNNFQEKEIARLKSCIFDL